MQVSCEKVTQEVFGVQEQLLKTTQVLENRSTERVVL